MSGTPPGPPTKHPEMEFIPTTSREYFLAWLVLDKADDTNTPKLMRKMLSDAIKLARLKEPLH